MKQHNIHTPLIGSVYFVLARLSPSPGQSLQSDAIIAAITTATPRTKLMRLINATPFTRKGPEKFHRVVNATTVARIGGWRITQMQYFVKHFVRTSQNSVKTKFKSCEGRERRSSQEATMREYNFGEGPPEGKAGDGRSSRIPGDPE